MADSERSIRLRQPEAYPEQAIAPEVREERHVRIVPKADTVTAGKVDRLKTLKDKIAEMKKGHKESLSVMEKEAKELEAELLVAAQQAGLTQIAGERFVAEFSPTVSRVVDPRKLLHFMQEAGTQNLFFEYISCPVTKVIKDMGEKVLIEKEVLHVDSKPFANMKLSNKSAV